MRQIEQCIHLLAREGRPFRRHLHLDQPPDPGHDEISVGARLTILGIIEIQHRLARVNATTDRCNMIKDGIARDEPCTQQLVHRQPQRDPSAGNRRAAGAAICLDHVAIDYDLPFPQGLPINARPQGPPDQALDFLRTAGLLASRGLAAIAAVGCTRQHSVFRRHPALPGAPQEGRRLFLDGSRTQHMRITHADQARSFGMAHYPGFN